MKYINILFCFLFVGCGPNLSNFKTLKEKCDCIDSGIVNEYVPSNITNQCEGYRAFEAELDIRECPYINSEYRADDWRKGWNQAKIDKFNKNKAEKQ